MNTIRCPIHILESLLTRQNYQDMSFYIRYFLTGVHKITLSRVSLMRLGTCTYTGVEPILASLLPRQRVGDDDVSSSVNRRTVPNNHGFMLILKI